MKRALTFTEYEKAQKTAASKVDQICKGVEKGQNLAADFNVESGELVPMFVPGPFAIAHHLISSWAHQVSFHNIQNTKKGPSYISIFYSILYVFHLHSLFFHDMESQ